MGKIYAVKVGRVPGIYYTWADCEKQVSGFSCAVYHSFKTKEEAFEYLGSKDPNTTTTCVNSSFEPKEKTQAIDIPLRQNSPLLSSEQGELIGYCDGSYKDQRGGYGYMIITPLGEKISGNGRAKTVDGIQNNQVSELVALEKLLWHMKLIVRLYEKEICTIRIYSDSDYAVKCMNEYIYKWMKFGWITSDGNTVKHQEIIHSIFDIMQSLKQGGIDIHIEHIYGHGKGDNKVHNYYNEKVDELANQGRFL